MPASSMARSSPCTSQQTAGAVDGRQERAEPRRVDAEVVDEEHLKVATPAVDRGRDVLLGSLLLGGDDRGKPEVDGALSLRRRSPLGDAGPQASAGRPR